MARVFPKETFTFWSALCEPVVGLPAYFLGKQGVHDAMLLPVIEFSKTTCQIEYFKLESTKIREINRLAQTNEIC